MALEQDPKTGKFVLKIAKDVDRHRAARARYQKKDLPPPRLTFGEWLGKVFGFGPNPFRPSPIADAIARRTQLIRACRGLRASGELVDQDHHLIEQVRLLLKDQLDRAEKAADGWIDKFDTALDDEELLLNECRPEEVRSELASEYDDRIKSIDTDFGPLAARRAEAEHNLSEFQAGHGLPTHYHWGEHFTTGNIALIGGIVLFEFILNSIFFAAANPLGLLGGAALALILSIATIVLGVAGGIAYQYKHPSAEGGGWFGKFLFGLVTIGALFYLLLLTLARMAGEEGDLHMFRTAADQITRHPLAGLFDLPSLGYFFFSIGVITYTGFKYVSIMGRFPGLRKRVLKAEHADAAWEQEIAAAVQHFRKVGQDYVGALNTLPLHVQETVPWIKNALQDYENVVDQLIVDVQAVGAASRLLFGFIRAQVVQTSIDVQSYTNVDCQERIDKFIGKLAEVRIRGAQLMGREEIGPASVERCRAAMTSNAQASLEMLQDRCGKIKQARLNAKRANRETDGATATLAEA